jgi:hypothetical protein
LLIISLKLIWVGSGRHFGVEFGHLGLGLFNFLLHLVHRLSLVNGLISNSLINDLTQLITHLAVVFDFRLFKRRNWDRTTFWQWVHLPIVIEVKEDSLIEDVSGFTISIQNIITYNDTIVVIVFHL